MKTKENNNKKTKQKHTKKKNCYVLVVIYTYLNLNATKCTFGHSDITSRKKHKAEK